MSVVGQVDINALSSEIESLIEALVNMRNEHNKATIDFNSFSHSRNGKLQIIQFNRN